MSTLRIHGIEAKSDPTSASVNEKIKITNSNGDLLFHLDGTQAGIGTVGITTTGTTFHVDRATGEITFVTDAVFNGTVGIAGTLTYEDVTNVDSLGIVTATAFHGDGSQLTGISAGAVGGASTNQVFYENDNSVDVSYTITTDRNAMAAGPIAIKAGVTVTVPSGSFLTIV
jgi:hypothetical protein